MVVADLHVHTTNSDGSLTLSTLADAAGAARIDAVAVTDHDRLHPDLRTPVATLKGLTVVHGIELQAVVVGDGDGVDSGRLGGVRERRQREVPVGVRRVHVEVRNDHTAPRRSGGKAPALRARS